MNKWLLSVVGRLSATMIGDQAKPSNDSWTEKYRYFLKMSTKDQISFFKRLAVLIKSGVPILSALQMLKQQAHTRGAKYILEQLHAQVEHGVRLSAGMRNFGQIFDEFTINVVSVGEASGMLDENLDYLAVELKKRQSLRRQVVSALIYPALICVATIGMTILLTVFVFPKVLPIFSSFKLTLPWTTRALITISNLLRRFWNYLLLGLVTVVALAIVALRRPAIRLWVDYHLLRLPIFGSLAQNYQLTSFTRTLSILLRSNMRIVEATQLVGNTLGNTAYRQASETIAEALTRGEKMSQAMARRPDLFPAMLTQMIVVGETTGHLSETLAYLAAMHEDDLNNLTGNLSTVIEPVLMIFMGVLVGFVAISIITPIYGLTQSLHL